jgi:transcriptional regulator with XRE-family HTH domain
MTSDQFRDCLEQIGWSQRGMAARLQIAEQQVRRWASGRYPIPPDVERWVAKLAKAHARNPPPEFSELVTPMPED